MNPVVVLPVARFDWHLAVKWLKWVEALSDRGGVEDNAYQPVVLCSPALTDGERDKLDTSGMVVVAEGIKEVGYFGTPNQMFKAAIEYVEKNYPGQPMLWCEADTVPMRPSWFREIADEYRACGKPVLADYIDDGGIPHITGNAVYPPNWRELFPSFSALPGPNPAMGWDSQCAPETKPQSAKSKTIRQVWRPIPFTASNWRNIVPDGTALFHQDKTGKLIDILCEERGLSVIPLEPALCESDYPSASHLSVPPFGITNVEILYVTCARDIEFLKYSLEAVKKFGKGFRGITIVVPKKEEAQFEWAKAYGQLIDFHEVEGKGMMHHEVMVTRADELCPNAQAILHLDADVMPWAPFTPDDVCPNGRPLMVRELYSECGRRNTNRLIWQQVVEKATGIMPEWETMVRHPQVHLREVYPFTRRVVEAHTGQKFDDYVLSCKNTFPHGYAEYPTIGAIVCQYFAGAYTMVNYNHSKDRDECGIGHDGFQYVYRKGRDKFVEFWSHGGFKMYEAWAIQFLDGRAPVHYMK